MKNPTKKAIFSEDQKRWMLKYAEEIGAWITAALFVLIIVRMVVAFLQLTPEPEIAGIQNMIQQTCSRHMVATAWLI